MPNLTIITGDRQTGKTTRANEILNTHHAAIIVDEAENRINTQPLLDHDMVIVLNVPTGTTVTHEHFLPRVEPEREYRMTGWPGCDVFHPQSEAEAKLILEREIRLMEKYASEARRAGRYSVSGEMGRRILTASYESRIITEWEAAS